MGEGVMGSTLAPKSFPPNNKIQSTLVISKSKRLSKILLDILTSTY